MGSKEANVRTALSVRDCGALFQQAAERSRGIASRIGGFAAKLNGNDDSGYFTPTDDSPFSTLDDDKPQFSVGVLIPKFNGGALGNAGALHMYVWDRSSHRDVRFYSPHGFGGGLHSSKLIGNAVRTLQEADPEARIQEG